MSIITSLKAENKTLFLYARIHKHSDLEEAAVVLVGFPVVAVHGVASRLGVAVHGADDRLGVVALAVVILAVAGCLGVAVHGADDRLAVVVHSVADRRRWSYKIKTQVIGSAHDICTARIHNCVRLEKKESNDYHSYIDKMHCLIRSKASFIREIFFKPISMYIYLFICVRINPNGSANMRRRLLNKFSLIISHSNDF